MPDHSTTHFRRLKRDATNSEGISITKNEKIATPKVEKKTKVGYSRWRRKILSHVTAVRIVIAALFLGVIALASFLAFKGSQSLDIPLYYNIAYNFVTAPVGQLASYGGRTNILVMGKAGGSRDYDSPDLTDTMMLVSVSLTDHNVKIISIPRDTWIPEIRAKINSAYYWGNQKTPGGGITFAKAITEEVVGVPIQYGVVIDFSGFKDIIDELGGIQVNVVNSFTDYYYPIEGKENDTCGGNDPQFMCRYQTISFKAGPQTMDGDTALEFVRSRHAEGIEGTDIAREARQELVIDAIKNKLINKKTYTDPRKDMAILKVILSSTQTDIDYPTAAILARRVYDSKNSIGNYIIPQELIVYPPVSKIYDMQAVIIPALGSGKWSDINKWVASVIQ